MNLRKTGMKIIIFGILGIFLMPYLPISEYIAIAIVTFLLGSGGVLVFFGSFDRMD